jgi:hypothetical protein
VHDEISKIIDEDIKNDLIKSQNDLVTVAQGKILKIIIKLKK